MQAKDIQNSIQEILEKLPFSIDDISIDVSEADTSFWCDISTKDSKALIGYKGETLKAVTHLVRKILGRKYGEDDGEKLPFHLTIDVNNYRKKHIEEVQTTAHMLAERARFFKSSVEANPMNAYDRRIVHEYLGEESDIETESVGTGRDRRVKIQYKAN